MRNLRSFLIALVFTVGAAASALAQTTVISTTLTVNDSGDTGLTARTVTTTPLLSGDLGQTTVTFLAPPAGASCSHSSIEGVVAG